MLPPVVPPSASDDDRLAAFYQLKIHLLSISPQISWRVRVRGDVNLYMQGPPLWLRAVRAPRLVGQALALPRQHVRGALESPQL